MCRGTDLGRRSQELSKHGKALRQPIRILVERERRRKRRDRRLVDTQGALHRIALDLLDEVGAADDDSGLGAAKQFVAAESDEVGAMSERF
jgi:hypothetical protein